MLLADYLPRSVAGAGKHATYESSKGLRLSERAIITSMSLEMQKDLLDAEASVKHEKLLSEKELKNDRKRSVEEIGPDSKHRLPAADKKLKYNQAEWTNFIRGHADRVLDIRREKILYLDIPVSTTRVSDECSLNSDVGPPPSHSSKTPLDSQLLCSVS